MYSIIIATYNSANTLAEAIQSVLQQTLKDFELIIIDGKSSDGTLEIIKSYEKEITYWISEKDKGVYDAWNKGIKIAKGEWICFLGSDDIMLPTTIEKYNDFIITNIDRRFEFISSKIEFVRNNLEKIKVVGEAWNWNTFKKYMNALHPGAMHHFTFFEKYGKYNIQFNIVDDYEILLRAKDQLRAGFLDEVTIKMRREGISDSYKAVYQTMQVKIEHRSRPLILIYWDFIISFVKFFGRRYL
jgi:glycosyltransferase involved in cell wall biosynthesis